MNRITAFVALWLFARPLAAAPLACNMSAFTPEQRASHLALTQTLLAAAERRPAGEGYALRLPAERWLDAARWAEGERRCCPFLRFELRSLPGEKTITLVLTGPRGVKRFLDAELGLEACP